MEAGNAVVSVDLFLTGEFLEPGKPVVLPKVDHKYAGHTYAYNRSVLANRVYDVVTAVAGLRKNDQVQRIELVATGEAGTCALIAAGLLGDQVASVLADANGLSFEKIPAVGSATFLSGALKYGGLGGLAALAAPTKLTVFGTAGIPADELAPLSIVYKAAGAPLTLVAKPLRAEEVVERMK